MKRPLGFADKLRIIIKWLRQHKEFGLVGTCSVCQSTRVSRTGQKEERHESVEKYTAFYLSADCGSTAEARETWHARPKAPETNE